MTEKGTNPKGSLSWGSTSTPKNTTRNVIMVAWILTLLSFLRVFMLGAIAFYASLVTGIILIRSNNKTAKINGWIVTVFFALRFILLLLVTYRVINP